MVPVAALLLAVFPAAARFPPAIPEPPGSVEPAIYGGEEALSDELIRRSVVRLERASGKTNCSGTLIERDVVATAAHCLNDVVAAYVIEASGAERRLKFHPMKVQSHPDYRGPAGTAQTWALLRAAMMRTSGLDVGVILLEEPAPEGFEPAELAAPGAIRAGATIVVAGFGWAESGEVGALRKVSLTVSHHDPAVAGFLADGRPDRIHPSGRGTCGGDSGGPAFVEVSGAARRLLLAGISAETTGEREADGSCKHAAFSGFAEAAARKEWLFSAAAALRGTSQSRPDRRFQSFRPRGYRLP